MGFAIELGTTTWTLKLIFKESLDITPPVHINITRLYAFHRRLCDAQPEHIVCDIANDMSYWHIEELARKHHLRFGQLPSATLGTI